MLLALKQALFPFLHENKFKRVYHPLNVPQIVDFNRVSQDKVECLMFVFEKSRRPMFHVGLAKGPLNGVNLNLPSNTLKYWGNSSIRPGFELCWRDCPGERAILLAEAGWSLGRFFGFNSGRWFRLLQPKKGDWQEASLEPVKLFIKYFPECETWWNQNVYSSHVVKDKNSARGIRRLEKKHGKFISEL